MSNSDQKLILDYLDGDKSSLEALIKRHLAAVYAFAYSRVGNAKEAEDITQEAFVRAWKNIKRFDTNKSFKAWIFSIAKNLAIDFFRKKKAAVFADFFGEEDGVLETIPDKLPLPDEFLMKKDIKNLVNSAKEKMSEKYRVVLSMYYESEMNFREIAEALGESVNTVKSRHRRALVIMHNILAEI